MSSKRRSSSEYEKLAVLEEWDAVCEPFRELKKMKDSKEERLKVLKEKLHSENVIIKTSSGYSRTKRMGGVNNV